MRRVRVRERTATPEEIAEDLRRCLAAKVKPALDVHAKKPEPRGRIAGR